MEVENGNARREGDTYRINDSGFDRITVLATLLSAVGVYQTSVECTKKTGLPPAALFGG